MALKAVHNPESFVWGPTATSAAGQAGVTGIISTSTRKSFNSEVELVGGDGELIDVLYSGAENTITETKYGDTFVHAIGGGTYDTGITVKQSIQYSNEDATRVTVEKLQKNTD